MSAASNKVNDGGPAFPLAPIQLQDGRVIDGYGYGNGGMTLRDWFAGLALAGWVSDPNMNAHDTEEVAKTCYRFADAMIAERERRPGQVRNFLEGEEVKA